MNVVSIHTSDVEIHSDSYLKMIHAALDENPNLDIISCVIQTNNNNLDKDALSYDNTGFLIYTVSFSVPVRHIFLENTNPDDIFEKVTSSIHHQYKKYVVLQ